MKFNLKNRPKHDEDIYPEKQYEEWFEEFERELRKELEICDIGSHYCEKCQKIEEILGE